MKTVPVILTAGIALAAASLLANETPPTPPQERLERGRYLVHQVSMCTDCHSPRDEKGAFIEARQLTGAPLSFAATVPMPWAPMAPRIAGQPAGYTEKDTIRFLMTGERSNGLPPTLPPMPQYRFNRNDAEAIAAYLGSLRPEAP